jgi:hypothetical protein
MISIYTLDPLDYHQLHCLETDPMSVRGILLSRPLVQLQDQKISKQPIRLRHERVLACQTRLVIHNCSAITYSLTSLSTSE